jgi:hypothetical protein
MFLSFRVAAAATPAAGSLVPAAPVKVCRVGCLVEKDKVAVVEPLDRVVQSEDLVQLVLNDLARHQRLHT